MKLVIEHQNTMSAGLDVPFETAFGSKPQPAYPLFDSNNEWKATTAPLDKRNLSFSVT
ncbi:MULTISPECIES: hypothetical protein [unclassified Mesorhizobium]|uniref:hypothetical protein n=1 Tax=unclassified Mesorhizobium TaxID=325217 RepID=UPI003014F86D